jgi:5'-AMP-activated protein kinase catalytic alpha subunit
MDEDGDDDAGAGAGVGAPAPANGTPVKDIRVKFEIQVYKMKDERYMIDFQRMDGGVMTCMDAAAAMMKNLRLT